MQATVHRTVARLQEQFFKHLDDLHLQNDDVANLGFDSLVIITGTRFPFFTILPNSLGGGRSKELKYALLYTEIWYRLLRICCLAASFVGGRTRKSDLVERNKCARRISSKSNSG